jgi:heat-inducible transcriptional repressor
LTERRSRILRSIIQEYISTATPVSSGAVANTYGLGVSPATIRNEMASLEEEGYIMQPHTSAGRVPSAMGYRYYVEALLEERALTQDEQRTIRHQFHQVHRGIDEWVHLSATILARMLNNVAIVTSPQLVEPKMKLTSLLLLRETTALMTVVFQNGSYRQQACPFDGEVTQEDLNNIANKLTDYYGGMSGSEMKSRNDELTQLEEKALAILVEIIDEETTQTTEEPYLDGLSQILSQPEFAKGGMAQGLMELIEERSLLRSILSQAPEDERLRVIIGSENPQSSMHDFSVVLSRYGLPEQTSGIVGIVGPTRMPYSRTFSAVRFLSDTMSDLLYGLYGDER